MPNIGCAHTRPVSSQWESGAERHERLRSCVSIELRLREASGKQQMEDGPLGHVGIGEWLRVYTRADSK
jgi:hypothetical protein